MSSDAYEEWKAKNPPRPDNEWERSVRSTQDIDKAIEKTQSK